VTRVAQLAKEQGDTIDDISCLVVFLEKRLILKNLTNTGNRERAVEMILAEERVIFEEKIETIKTEYTDEATKENF
jgi:hypothetical protein